MSEQGFRDQIGKTLDFEGGYVHDPDDPGGETNFGISKRSYPDLDIAALTRDDAIAIYQRDFWPPWDGFLDQVAGKLFDMAVNMGHRRAVILAQRAINNLGTALLAVDGQLGPRTRAAIAQCAAGSLLGQLRAECRNFYAHLAADHPAMRKYLKGWLRRANS